MKIIVALSIAVLAAVTPTAAQAPAREIIELQDGLYRVRADGTETIFLVTTDGIILGDPLWKDTAAWLKDELRRRFPSQPVRYVILTSHQLSRSDGGAVLAVDATLVAQRNFTGALRRAQHVFSADLAALDRDGNGALDAPEIASSPRPAMLTSRDRNKDGQLTPGELYAGFSDAHRHFNERETIIVGGRSVEAIHTSSAHAPDAAVLLFRKERIAFATDTPPLESQGGFGAYSPREVLHWSRTVDGLPFDTLLTADGRAIAHDQVTGLHRYMQALFDTVADGFDAGRSVPQIQATAGLEAFRSSPMYAGRQSHIAAAYQDVRLKSAEIYGVGVMAVSTPNDDFCEGYSTCTLETRVPGIAVGLRFSPWRHLGIAGEVTFGTDRASRRVSQRDEDLSERDTRFAVLTRFGTKPGAFVAAVVAGGSLAVIDTKGFAIRRGSINRPTPIERRASRIGATAGFDFAFRMGRDVSLLIPFRATMYLDNPETSAAVSPVAPLDIQAGIGISIRFKHNIRAQ